MSDETIAQLARYCYRIEHGHTMVYTNVGAIDEYKLRLYGLRENCRILVHMLVEPYV
jgi:hypothetical protein